MASVICEENPKTMRALRRTPRGLLIITAWSLALVGCLDDIASDTTTPRRRPTVRTSDDGVGGGVSGAGSRAVPRPRAFIPGGLGMRDGSPVSTRPAPGVKKGSAAGKAPWKGGPKAKVIIEEFTDFECPFCKKGWRVMDRVIRHYGGKVRLVFRHMPITKIHPQAMQAAEAAVCAQRQGKFWAMQDQIFSNNKKLSRANLIRYARRIGLNVPKFTKTLDSGSCKAQVLRDMKRAKTLGVSATPAFIVNGTKVEGAYPFRYFKKIIDAELAD